MDEIKEIRIDLANRSYPILIGQNLLAKIDKILHPYIKGKVFIITDENVAPLYLDQVQNALNAQSVIVKAGEESKSWETAAFVCEQILNMGCDRRSVLISLGGGVVGDLTGFCASILERGVDFIQIPTTLLAQTDSSVGGKTAINTKAGKNLIGTFYQPKAVIIDTDTLKTLPKRQVLNGYAEVAKYGLILKPEFWAWLEQNGQKIIDLDPEACLYAIEQSCLTKAEVVIADEREEKDLRALLNLGHTFGHAFEAASGLNGSVLHGEGVAAGCVYAAELSKKLGLSDLTSIVERHFKKIGLPVAFGDYQTSDLLSLMLKDKKTTSAQLNFVLLKSIGQAVVVKNIDKKLVAEVLEKR